jgi:hypothetical protein
VVILTAVGLLAGLAAGYAAGERHGASRGASSPALSRPTVTAAPTTAPATLDPTLALTQVPGGCSVQMGRELQLGVQVTNQSAAEVTLRRVEAVLPLGGLKAVSQQWAPCGALPADPNSPANSLPVGASAWFTVTFKVLLRCPGPLPVEFAIDYDMQGQPFHASIPGFSDLGHVPYTGCAAS